MKGRSLLGDYAESLRRPEFWIYSTWLELVTKYRRSRLGLFWVFLPPFLYAFVVGGFFARLQGYDIASFIPHMAIGYVLFRFVTVSLNESTTTCAHHAAFILDGRVRLTDYMLRVMAKAGFYLVFTIPVVALALWISPTFEPLGLVTLLPSMLLLLLNVGWMAAIVAIIGARLTDVYEFIGSIMMFGFLFTPIIWTAEQVPAGTFRGSVARANPLFHFVELVRAPILGESLEPFTIAYVIGLLVIGWLAAALVYRRYARFVPVWV
ncbi:ABC transporter permease [Luteimonas sp. RD2P54]|uniref:ABC transporter permease n=1 Tax=Luteimonas endophytica TaxID=3042023 RepID=A0ABT6J836_9GAMM|nr:ABC transporter permease [Luteimonas endophytica]MDH5822991.1 ABC transporter permease [Luteimonas endophytica]